MRGAQRFTPKRLRAGVLLALLFIGAVLRWEGIEREPMWLDEIYSLELSVGRGYRHVTMPLGVVITNPPNLTTLANAAPWWRIWVEQRTDAHPPLYFMLLRVWRAVIGESATAARAMSMVVSLAAIPLIYLIGREMFRPGAGLWAAALMALSPLQAVFARETRPYAMATTVALAGALAAVAIYRRGWNRRRGILLALALLAMMLTHYLTAGAALGIFVWLMLALRGRERMATLGTFVITGTVYAAIWGPILLEQVHYTARNLDWLREPGSGHAVETLRRARPMPLQLLAPVMSNSTRVAPLVCVIYMLPLLLVRKNPRLLLPMLWVAGTLGLLVGMDIARSTAQLNQMRYPLIAAPGIYLLLAGMLSHWRGYVSHIVPAAAAVYCIVSLPALHDKSKEDWREAAQWIGRDGGDGVLAVLSSSHRGWDWESAPSTLYLGTSYYQAAPGMHYLLLDRPADARLMEQVRTYRAVYLVDGWPGANAADALPGMTPANSQRVDRIGRVFNMAVR